MPIFVRCCFISLRQSSTQGRVILHDDEMGVEGEKAKGERRKAKGEKPSSDGPEFPGDSTPPEFSGEHGEEREDLEPTEEHDYGQGDFHRTREMSEIVIGSDLTQTRAHVADGGH